jgi:hypothetical protein
MGLTAVGIASAVGGIGSAIIGSSAARSAARTQAAAANNATNQQLAMFYQIREDLAPYAGLGQLGINNLTNLVNSGVLTADYPNYTPYGPYRPVTAANLEQTPGYQFTRDQGIRAVTNSNSASGLTGSGAQARAIAEYVTGLAQSTYNQQVQNRLAEYMTGLQGHIADYQTGLNTYESELTNLYNRLMGLAQIGQNSAAQQAATGTQVAGLIGNNIIGMGNALASGQIGSANAIASGLNTALTGASNAYLINQLLSRYGSPASVSPAAAAAAS